LDWGKILNTGVKVEKGQVLTLKVASDDTWQGNCGPNGANGAYRRGSFTFSWSTLVATLDEGHTFMKVGYDLELSIQTSGTLGFCCWDTQNSDNRGSLTVDVRVWTPDPDDLSKIEGIGPKISGLLQKAEITTFAKLAETSAEQLREIFGCSRTSVCDRRSHDLAGTSSPCCRRKMG